MLVRLKLHGTGSPSDPVRANFPTYGTVGVDPIAGTIVVDVPDDHLPPNIATDPGTAKANTVYGPALTGMSAAMSTAWGQLIAAKHPTLPYQPDLALV